MKIELHIERLVLDGVGFERGRTAQLQAAVAAELTRLLSERGLPTLQAGAVPRVDARDVALAPAAHPVHAGHQIARSVFAAITPRVEPSTGKSPR